jgi:hypothetical protein
MSIVGRGSRLDTIDHDCVSRLSSQDPASAAHLKFLAVNLKNGATLIERRDGDVREGRSF